MNRRSFLIGLTSFIAMSFASIESSLANVVWAKLNVAGYKELAPAVKLKKNEKCLTCKYFKDEKKTADGGLCSYNGISKGQAVYVKKEGICSMYVRKA